MNELGTSKPASDAAADALNEQVDAMSLGVNHDRDQRCAQMRADVGRQALDILRAARKEARAQVRAAVVLERRLAAQASRQANASAWLEQQRLTYEQTRSVLRNMWSAIPAALESRWADPARRKSWIQSAGQQAQKLLIEPAWRITHGAGWSAQELDELRVLRRGHDDARAVGVVELECEPNIRAGIRISVKGACLDATAGGLLTSRSQVESKFLALMLVTRAP